MSRPSILEFLLHTTLDRAYGGLLLPDLTNLVLEYLPPPCVSCGESRTLYPCWGHQLFGTRRRDLHRCASTNMCKKCIKKCVTCSTSIHPDCFCLCDVRIGVPDQFGH